MQQPAFEFYHATPPPTVNQQRDQAMARVAAHAEQARADFLADAKACMLRYLAQHESASGEVLSAHCKDQGIVPPDDRAFGPVLMALVRERWIEKCGSCRRAKGHGTAGGNLWRAVRGAICLHGIPIEPGSPCVRCQTDPADDLCGRQTETGA
jgi:hypothetical protein